MDVNPKVKESLDGSARSAAEAETIAGIINQRGKTHGDAFKNLEDIADRWTKRLRAKGLDVWLTVADVCYFMDEVKLSRSCFGDPLEVDHLSDTAGYSIIGTAWLRKNKEDRDAIDAANKLATKRSTEPCC